MKRLIILLIFAILVNGTIFAQSWEHQTSPTSNTLYAVTLIDSCTGWAVGDSGTIIYTTNGGSNWITQMSGTTLKLSAIDFVDANNGWVVGDFGTILCTTNGGAAWTFQVSGTDSSLSDVNFVDSENGWAVGGTARDDSSTNYFPIILRTTNGDDVWTTQFSDTGYSFSGVDFVDVNHGWAVGDGAAEIVHTTDGGITWVTQDSIGYYPALADVDFIDVNNGFVVGSKPAWQGVGAFISRTTDGGNTWTELSVFGIPLRNVDFIDLNYGWVLGGGYFFNILPLTSSVIRNTTDGGDTWTAQLDTFTYGWYPEAALFGLDFVDMNHGWAVGGGGIILKYNPDMVSVNEQIENHPSSIELNAFPNPFNAQTTIQYSLPEQSMVTIDIFDILGRKIETLSEGLKPAGEYQVTWDAINQASGVYFYRIKAGDKVETKRMMLVK